MMNRALSAALVRPDRSATCSAMPCTSSAAGSCAETFSRATRLPNEAELGRELGASRTVVREAVKSLASKGLIEPRTRVGTKVLPSTQWNLLDLDVLGWRYGAMPPMQFFRELSEIRRMIEPEAAALAAERATRRRSRHHDARLIRTWSRRNHRATRRSTPTSGFIAPFCRPAHNALILQMGGLISVG